MGNKCFKLKRALIATQKEDIKISLLSKEMCKVVHFKQKYKKQNFLNMIILCKPIESDNIYSILVFMLK